MQQILVDMAVLGLVVFLFFVMARGRGDNRLWLWTGGWFCVASHSVLGLWSPADPLWQNVQACISIDVLLLAASCFIYSHALLRLPEHETQAIAAALIPSTLLTVDLAICGWPSTLILAILVCGRQLLAIYCILRSRRQLHFAGVSSFTAALIGAWIVFSVLHGHREIVVYGLLCEVYLSAAVNFYAYGWRSSVAVRTMIAGFVAWAAVFPITALVAHLWPGFHANPEIWNIPKFFVAIGMILTVIEEDTRTARALGEDYRLLFDDNPQPFWIFETETLRLVAVNQAALDLHGYSREEFLRMSLPDLLAPEPQNNMRAALQTAQEKFYRNRHHLRKDGSSVFIDIRVQEIAFQGKPCQLAHGIDVTEREELQQQLDHQAKHDRLTGLPNRVLLLDQLSSAVQHAIEAGEKLAVLSIDADRFKRINDAYGLRIGDAYIERIASMLVSRMRSVDIVARTGGDEFTIVLTGLKTSVPAEQEVRDLMHQFEEPIVVHGYKIQIPISIGVAVGPDDALDAMALWRGAESALREAKISGGATAVWLSSTLRHSAEEELQLEEHLRNHMKDGGFHLAYQPIYGSDGLMRGIEALLRLSHPKLGQVSPAKLIPVAESSGLIIPLGEWVIEEVCRQILIWKSQQLALVPVAVNISGLQIMHEEFAGRLMATLQRYAIDPRLIHLEITESVALRNVDAVTEKIIALSARGIEFSIDDFGTGHSSFARLSQLGTSILKIDRSLLSSDCSLNAHSIVQAIITMAHALGHRVVAEGVETESQLTCLRHLQCDLYQGYLLSRPIPSDQIAPLLGKANSAFGQLEDQSRTLRLIERAAER